MLDAWRPSRGRAVSRQVSRRGLSDALSLPTLARGLSFVGSTLPGQARAPRQQLNTTRVAIPRFACFSPRCLTGLRLTNSESQVNVSDLAACLSPKPHSEHTPLRDPLLGRATAHECRESGGCL